MYEGFPGEVKTFFVRGLMFPNEEVFSSSLAHGAVGSVGCSSPLGVALHSGTARSFCFSPPRCRFLGVGVFVVFFPPPRPPRIRTSVRMVDAIVGWVDGERKDTPTTG